MSSINQSVVTTHNMTEKVKKSKSYKWDIVWINVFIMGLLHLAALYGFFLRFNCMWKTSILSKVIGTISSLGITGGAHRLWSHRTYKANTTAQIILMCMASMTYQNSIYTWCRDHRLHHKYSETDADPHNATRGFFFSHLGWILLKKHPEVKEKGKEIDMSDLQANPIVMFQHKYYYLMVFIFSVGITTFIPWYFWNEDLLHTIFVTTIYRYVFSVHITWTINSLAHLYGNKPYDKNIGPTENLFASYFGFGEGFHNYHHTFPYDYKAAELGNDARNLTTLLIDAFAFMGWVTDRRVATDSVIKSRIQRTGDSAYTDETTNNFSSFMENRKISQLTNVRNSLLCFVFIVCIV